MNRILICVFLLFSSCSSRTVEDYREEAAVITHAIVKELVDVQTKDALVAKIPRLKKKFNELAEVIIEAAEFEEKHPSLNASEVSNYVYLVNNRLKEELERLYAIDGARQIIEKSQSEALHRLAAFEHRKEALKGKKISQTLTH